VGVPHRSPAHLRTPQGLFSAAAFRPWRGSQAEVAQGPGRGAAHPLQTSSVLRRVAAGKRAAGL